MNLTKKTAVVLINLGTPDSPQTGDVRKYLSEFLNDPRVIDIPWLARKLLVNAIIVPFRAPKSAKVYKELWDDRGSPLLYHTQDLAIKLQNKFKDSATVFYAMRYGNPSMDFVLGKIKLQNFDKIIIVPLYPQYASSTSGSIVEKAMKIIQKWWVIPELTFTGQFYNNAWFIDAFAKNAENFDLNQYDHIVFSYHGLPNRQVDKVYTDNSLCEDNACETEITHNNKFCYKAACYETTRLLAKKLNIPEEKYTVAFQSRLDKDWLEPFADKVVIERAQKGDKKLLFFSPAFVADCLETTIEIGDEYKELFIENGGEQLDLVPSLNSNDLWVEFLHQFISEKI
ncbi:MAG TPA: ferrochelatase [Flavobacteriales bacterium]|nr:ferrochelatase [Flavobacteriales bacterium]|tara:strand:- start:50647 stop:51669 length:1023 start_codon:yes stop_codon:yes gene_type:complete